MSLKVLGLDKLQKQLQDAERAFRSLDGTIATLRFDPNEPASVQVAIKQMENAIDTRAGPYRGNEIVDKLASQMKAHYREQIEERARHARSVGGTTIMMDSESLPDVLRQVENTVNDLRWADRSSFVRHIKKLSRLLHLEELDNISRELVDGVNFDAWIAAGEATQGGMIGSAELEWPDDPENELGLVVSLIDRIAEDPGYGEYFSRMFYWTGNEYVRNLQNMTSQIFVPFARDYINYVKTKTGVTEATKLSTNKEPAARKVFVVHGHDEASKQSVSRFLENLGFEAIILHEQANRGQTIIEKLESNSDVGFAVVLLTPDDEGNTKGEAPQPRARQNVILELGYFLARLGRSRVMALVRDEVEIPSDYPVVYQPMTNDGGWKQALANELIVAGFDIDWNIAMKR